MYKIFESFKEAYLNESLKTPWFDKNKDVFNAISSNTSTSNLIDVIWLLIPIWNRKKGGIFDFNKNVYTTLSSEELKELTRIVKIVKSIYGDDYVDDMAHSEIKSFINKK